MNAAWSEPALRPVLWARDLTPGPRNSRAALHGSDSHKLTVRWWGAWPRPVLSRGFAASEEARVTSRPSDGGGRTDAARSVRGVEIGVPLYMLGGVPVVGGLAYAVYGIWPSMYVVGKGERSQFSLPGLCPPGNGRFVDRPVSSVRAGCCHDHSEKNVTRNDRTGQCGSVQQRTREGIDSESHQMAPAPLGPLLSESRRPAALSCAYPPDGLYFGP